MQLGSFSTQKVISSGFANEIITPNVGLQLAGFLGERKAIGTHDDLKVRVFYMSLSNKKHLLLIVFDLLEVPREFSSKIKATLTKKFGIEEDKIIISATHTHSGPEIREFSFKVDKGSDELQFENGEKLIEFLKEKSIYAVSKAIKKSTPGQLEFGSFLMKNKICGNRREQEDPQKVEVKFLLFKGHDGKKALIYNLGCHPTVLHESNVLYSADFPGAVEKHLLDSIKNLEFVMFINGAAGDMSTRFYRKASDFDEVKRIGTILANEIVNNINNTEQVLNENFTLESAIRSIRLNLKEPMPPEIIAGLEQKASTDLEKARANNPVDLRKYEARLEGIKFLKLSSDFLNKNRTINSVLQLIKIGNVAFVSIPGELFSSLGHKIELELSPLKVILVGYANDYIGYILDEESYEKNEYESFTTFLAKGEGERIINEIVSMKDMLTFKEKNQ
ncbi:MAG: hypothetical protein ACP5QM_05145 [Caldisericum sp.]|uniref:hypothetical protein n=1 Tax=Caldisericum sp. TaxID=2499687 RepID=UPI003CA41BE2